MTSTPDFTVVCVSEPSFDLQTLAKNDVPILVQLKSTAFSLYHDLVKLGFSFFDTGSTRSDLEIRLYKCPFIDGLPQVGDNVNVAIIKCIKNGRIPVIMKLCHHYYKHDDSMTTAFAKLDGFKYTELHFTGSDFLSHAKNCNNDGRDFIIGQKESLDELELHKKLVRLPIPAAVIDTCFMGYLPVVRADYSERISIPTSNLEPLKITMASPTVGGVETHRFLV